MTPLEALCGARELLSDPKKWTKGGYALSAAGENCDVLSDAAACWCLTGALARTTGNHMESGSPGSLGGYGILAEAIGKPERLVVSSWNDEPGRSHTEVLALLDKAIELARSRQ